MSLVSREDRDSLHTMYHAANGTGAESSDSSRKRRVSNRIDESNREQLWKRPPVPIPTPGTQSYGNGSRQMPSGIKSPFPQGNYNDLRDRHSRRNPSALALVPPHRESKASSIPVRSDKPPAHKKQKLEKSTPMAPHMTSVTTKQRRERSSSPKGSTMLNSTFQGKSLSFTNGSADGRVHTSKSSGFVSDDHLRLFTSTRHSEVIDLEQDEDLGEPVSRHCVPQTPSSDDMQLIPLHDNSDANASGPNSIGEILGVDKLSHRHVFSESILEPNIKPPPSAGPNTRALKAQVTDARQATFDTRTDENDPVEDSADFDNLLSAANCSQRQFTPSGTTAFSNNYVRDKIDYFEKKIPEVDLRSASKKKAKVRGMKKKDPMTSPKGQHSFHLGKRPATPCQDQFAATSAHLSLTQYTTSNDRQRVLPLEAYACGSRIVGSVDSEDPTPRYWLRVRDNRVSIVQSPIESGSSLGDFELARDICSASLPHLDLDPSLAEFPLIELVLLPNETTNSFLQRTSNSKTQEKLVLTIKPLVSHANWSLNELRSICDFMRAGKKIGTGFLNSAAFRAKWKALLQSQDTPSDSPRPRATRSRPKPQPTYIGAAQDSSPSTTPDVRRSSRRMTFSRQSPRLPSPPWEEIILLYPPTGTGAVNVTNGDLNRLEPGEFLNDTLIELGLKFWLNDLRNQRPEFADQVHVFSSFFYTQLNHKNFGEGYQSVRKWTSRFDLFKKKYLIVPINEHMHWYLAIICHPERTLQHPPLTPVVKPNVTTRIRAQESSTTTNQSRELIIPSKQSTSTPAPRFKNSSTSMRVTTEDEQEVDRAGRVCPVTPRSSRLTRAMSPSSSFSSLTIQADEESVMMEVTANNNEGRRNAMCLDETMESNECLTRVVPEPIPPKNFYARPESTGWKSHDNMRVVSEDDAEEAIDQLQDDDHLMDVDITPLAAAEPARQEVPYIFSFDSLGTRHPHALKVLARYLDMEAKDKKGWADPVQPVVKTASVPPQPNYCDCGVYLLHFVEQFMSDPEDFTQLIIQPKSKKGGGSDKLERERLWSHDKVAGRRHGMKQRILSLSAEWKAENGKGKGKPQIEGQPKEAGSKSPDPDSEIEVLEVNGKSSKPVQVSRTNKAARVRG